jgi:hypothetical protein
MKSRTRDIEAAYIGLLGLRAEDRLSQECQRMLCNLLAELAARYGQDEQEVQAYFGRFDHASGGKE